jgi:hypothetical protein
MVIALVTYALWKETFCDAHCDNTWQIAVAVIAILVVGAGVTLRSIALSEPLHQRPQPPFRTGDL